MKIEETFGGSIDDSGLEKLLNSVINSGNNGTVNTTLNIKPKVDKNNDLKMLIKSLSDAFSLSEDLATSLANVYKTGKNNRANKLFDFSDETLAIERMTQAYKEFLKAQESGFKGQKERAKITDFISAGSIIKAGRGNLDIIPKEIAEAFEKVYSEVTAKSGGEKYAYSISNFKALISALDDIKNTNPQANLKEIVKYLQTEVQHKSKEVTSSSNKLFKGINIEDFLSFDNTRLSKELEETFDQLDRLEEKFDKFDGIDNLDLLPDINKAELEDLTNERIELEKIAYVLIEIAKQRKFKIDDVLGGGYYENYEDAQRNLGLDSLGTLKHDKELLKDDKFNRKDEFIKGFREAVAEYISNALQRQVGDFENQLANDKVIQSVMNSDDIADEFKEKFYEIISNARKRIKNGDVFGIANVVDQLLKENIVFSDEVFKAYLPNFNIKDENVDDYNKLIETKIDELWDNTKADIITIYDLIDEVSKTIDQNGWRIKSEAQQEIDSYFNRNNNGNGFGFGGGNNYNESESDSILNGDYSDEIQDYSKILELLERIYTVFEGIANTVDNLSKSIGVISDENGFTSLLSTLKDVNSYFENIRDIVEDIASRDLSPTLNIQANQSGDTYNIRKRAQRYKENYENAFSGIGYTNLFSFLAQSGVAEKYDFSADKLKKQFGSEAINGIENKEDQIERIVQFFKLIDAAIDERAEEIETARKLLEKGVGNQSDLDALINDETYSQLLENQSRRFVSTNQKYINKQNAQSIAQANNSPLSSANKLLDSLNDASIVGKLDEILNVTQSIYSTLEAKRTRGSGESTGRNSVLDALREEILPKYNRVSSKAKYDVASGNWSLSSGMSAEDLDIVSEITKSIKKAKEKNIDIAKLFSEDGQDIAEGIAEGIEEGQSAINSSLTEITNKAQEHFEDINIIHSPARRWYPVGENITLGIAEGVKQGYYSLEDAMDYITHLAETEAGRNIISEDSTKDLDFKGAVTPISELRAELVQMGYDADVVDHILFDMRDTLYNGFDKSSVIGLVSSISMLGGATEEAKNDIRELTEVQEENAKVTNNEADTVETLQHELNNNQEPIKIKVEPLVDANEFVGNITSAIQNVPAKVKVEPEIEEKPNTPISESVEKVKQESEDVTQETNVLTSLLPIIQQVTDAVNLKTQAFENEGEKVNEVVLGEFNALQKYLLPILEELRKAAEELSESFKGFNSVNTFINKLTGNNSAETIKKLGKNLKSLGTYLTNLKIDDTQFIDAINNIVSNAKDLKKVIDVIEKANKSGISSKKKGKNKKEKDPVVDLYKELTRKNNRILELNNKQLLDGLSPKEAGELEVLIQQYNRIQQEIEDIGSTSEEAAKAYRKFKEAAQDASLGFDVTLGETLQKRSQDDLNDEINKLNKLREKAEEVYKNIDKYTKNYRDSLEAIATENIDTSNLDVVKKKIEDIQSELAKKTIKENLEGTFNKLSSLAEKIQGKLADANLPPKIRQGYQELADEIKNLINTGSVLPGTLNKITRAFMDLNAQDSKSKGFFRSVADRTREMNVKFLGQFFSFYDIIRYGRQIFSTIQELDTALVDLRKTTSMTAQELDEFYYESGKVAKEMGVTSTEIIQTAANWSRLGYSTKEAATEMAALSSQFAAISPGMDVEKATDGLVSSMKAFHVEVESVESDLMDPINRLGNTMATTNEEIVDMLERSSAAMAAANNSIDETLALESAAVQITRNAETTGTAFRTISMRIRGLDEETEELSEDLANISGDIADLTKSAAHPNGISLFTDKDKTTYKSTYQLLKDISEVYDELEDKQQAALLEKLAGKRGGQVLAGILGKENFAEVERAMKEITNAAGSADAEMEIIKDSVEYKLNALKNTWIDYAKELLSRDDVGKIIDALINASEKLEGTIDALAPSIEVIINFIAKLIEMLGEVIGKTGKATPYIIMLMLAFKKRDGLIGTIGELKSFLGLLGKIPKTGKDAITTLRTIQMLRKGASTTDVLDFVGAAKAGATAEEIQGITGAATKATTAIEGLSAASGVLIALLPVVAAVGITAWYKWYHSTDQIINRHKELREEIKSVRDEYHKLAEEALSKKNNLSELVEQYEQAVEGSDEYLELANKIAEIAPSTVIGYTPNGDKILGDIDLLKEELALLDEVYEKNRRKEEKENKKIVNAYAGKAEDKEGKKLKSRYDDIKGQIEFENNEIKANQEKLNHFLELRNELIKEARAENPSITDEELENVTAGVDIEIEKYDELIRESQDKIDEFKIELDEANADIHDAYLGLLPTKTEMSDGEKAMREMLLKIADETHPDSTTFKRLYETAGNVSEDIWKNLFAFKDKSSSLSQDEYLKQAEAQYNIILSALKEAGFKLTPEQELGLKVYLQIDEKSIANAKQKAANWAKKNEGALTRYDNRGFKVNDSDALDWYQKLNEEQRKIADSDEFSKELEIQKKNFDNVADACQAAFDAVQKYNNAINEDQGHSSVKAALEGYKIDENTTGKDRLDDYYEKADAIDEIIKKITNGDYTDVDLAQWRVEYDLVGESAEELTKELNETKDKAKEAAIEVLDKLIESHPNDKELIKSLNQIKDSLNDISEAAKQLKGNANIANTVDQFESLSRIYETFKENSKSGKLDIPINISDVEALREAWGDLASFDEFERIVTTAGSSAIEVQEAFNQLSTEYANTKIDIDHITEATKAQVASQLELAGATKESAQAFVDYYANVHRVEQDLDSSNVFKGLVDDAQVQIGVIEDTKKKLEEYSKGGNVDLTIRPKVDTKELEDAGWKDVGKGIATVFSSSFTDDLNTKTINFTPIIVDENGNKIGIMSPEKFDEYCFNVVNGVHDDYLKLQIGAEFKDADEAGRVADEIHRLHEVFYNLVDPIELADDAIEDNKRKLEEEAEQLGITTQALAYYVFEEQIADMQKIDTASEVSSLIALAGQANVTGDCLAKLIELEEIYIGLESGVYGKGTEDMAKAMTRANELQKEIQGLYDKGAVKPEVKVDKNAPKLDFNGAKGKGGSGSEQTPETFDWIETKIQRLERDITNLGKTADATYKTWAERTVALGQEMEKVNEQISLQETAYNAYMAKAESVGLSAQYKKLVQSGALKIDEITDETLKEQINNYKEWYIMMPQCLVISI